MRIPLAKPYIPREDVEMLTGWFREILETKQLVNGKFTKLFEEETAAKFGRKHAVALNSCTTALQIVLDFAGVKGKKVIIPVNTFIATGNAVLFAGAQPIFADIGEDLLIDFKKIEKLIDAQTAALIVVHVGGYVHPHIERIAKLCKERNVVLIEDCAHAHGATLNGKPAGSWGFAATYSYYATKVQATGVGGILTTDDEVLDGHARIVRFHGEAERSIQSKLGSNWLMTEFQAALGLSQLRRLDEILMRRMTIAHKYDEEFKNADFIRTFPLQSDSLCGYYKYPVRILPPASSRRVKAEMANVGIQTGVAYWPPLHLQPVYNGRLPYKAGDFPIAEKVLQEVISLPIYPDMSLTDADEVIGALVSAIKKQKTEAVVLH